MGDDLGPARPRPVRNLAVLILVAVTAAIVLSPNASAHVPEFDSGGDSYTDSAKIGDISVSRVFYGDLPYITRGDPEGARYFTFEGTEGQLFEFMIGGKVGSLIFPGLLLVGPGLPEPNGTAESIINATGLEIPDGLGVMGWQTWPDGYLPQYISYEVADEFEPFTQTRFWTVNHGNLTLPDSGTYYVIVTGPIFSGLDESRHIEYFLATGSEERFTIADFVLISWYWFRVQGSWGINEDFPFITPALVIVLLGLAADYGSRRSRGTIERWSRPRIISHYAGTAGALVMAGIGANQILFLAFFSSYHDWKGIVLLVLAMQAACVIIGLLALRATCSRPERPDLSAAGGVAAITGAALLFGAGMIVGPVLFVLGAAIAWTSWYHAGRKRRKSL